MNELLVFVELLKIDDLDHRLDKLSEMTAGNSELRARVEELLAAHARASGFMPTSQHPGQVQGTPPGAGGSPTSVMPEAEKPGEVIGPYKLLQEIGEGGMGSVFMAEQSKPVQRRVALKIIKAGMDTRQVIARFEAERQALALMDHPNIAKVLDAGTTSAGRPYFVMELVKGVPITKYCDDKHLHLKDRLELFIQVCHAIQHAHQKGIIHRDIKPSNVLVAQYDGKPVPKVIDFGVAKATAQKLTEKTMFTEFGMVIGTVEYMSPEQAEVNQLDIDTRSDVYSLGVLLYELLTGTTPLESQKLRSAAFQEMLRMIREEEPSRPSIKLSSSARLPSIAANRGTDPARLKKFVQGELDWIVMKTLEKERSRRYSTPVELGEDLGRYLRDEAVLASPPSNWYRFSKIIRRHRALILTSLVIAASLLVGAMISVWQGVNAMQSAKEAKAKYQVARRAVDEMYTEFAEKWIASQMNLTDVQRDFLQKSLAFYEQFAEESQQDVESRWAAASARDRVARIQQALGQFDAAESQYQKAVAEFSSLSKENHQRHDLFVNYLECRAHFATLLAELGRSGDAASIFKEIFVTGEEALASNSESQALREMVGAIGVDMGRQEPDLAKGAEILARSRMILEEAEPNSTTQLCIVRIDQLLADNFKQRGMLAEARAAKRRASETMRGAMADPSLELDPLDAMSPGIGSAFVEAESIEVLLDQAEMPVMMLEAIAEETEEREAREMHVDAAIECLGLLNDSKKIKEQHDKLLPAVTSLCREFPRLLKYQRQRNLLRFMLADYYQVANPGMVKSTVEAALEHAEKMLAERPDDPEAKSHLGVTYIVAAGHFAFGPTDDRNFDAQRARQLAAKANDLLPKMPEAKAILGVTEFRCGNFDRSISLLSEALAANDEADEQGRLPDSYDCFFLAMAYAKKGDADPAKKYFDRADQWLMQYERESYYLLQFPSPADAQKVRNEAAAVLGVAEVHRPILLRANNFVDLLHVRPIDGFVVDGGVPDGKLGYPERGTRPLGDINQDGVNDFLIAAPAFEKPVPTVGEVYLLFGSATRSENRVLVSPWSSNLGYKLIGLAAGDRFGVRGGGAGDFNGDGAGDIVLQWHSKVESQENLIQASIFLLFGGKEHLAAMDRLDGAEDATIHLAEVLKQNGSEHGFRVSCPSVPVDKQANFQPFVAGLDDINGDVYGDLAVTSWILDDPENPACRLKIWLGGPGKADTSNLREFAATTEDVIEIEVLAGCRINNVAALGDLNGDKVGDFAFGAVQTAKGKPPFAGAYVVFGGKVIPPRFDVSAVDGKNGFVLERDAKNRSFPILAVPTGAGDLNDDGFADLVVGAARSNPKAGYCQVIYGKAEPYQARIAFDQLSEKDGFRILGGQSVGAVCSAAGDVNGDGVDDLLISGPSNSFTNKEDPNLAGVSYLLYGSKSLGKDFPLYWLTPQAGGDQTRGLLLEAHYNFDPKSGTSKAMFPQPLGDVNGDGLADFRLSAPNFLSGASVGRPSEIGRAFIILGRPSPKRRAFE